MIPTITHDNIEYPAFQSQGFAAQFAFSFARHVCRGYGVDIGCNRKEWAFVDVAGTPALMVDPVLDPEYHAYNLPPGHFDYIFSSHCLEHLENWVKAIDYWHTKLKKGGTMLLYLPHFSQGYWRPWNNMKHVHVLDPDVMRMYLTDRGWKKIFVSGADLNNSFMVMAEK